jgi:hypothetical protein
MKPSQKHADKIFYEIAGAEIESGNIDRGLMVKAISKSGGDKKKAELIYLEWRIELLKEQAVEIAEKNELERIIAKEKAEMEAEDQLRKRALEKEKRDFAESEKKYNNYIEEQRLLPFYKKDNVRETFWIFLALLITFLGILILGVSLEN